jgi:hypothetical protein
MYIDDDDILSSRFDLYCTVCLKQCLSWECDFEIDWGSPCIVRPSRHHIRANESNTLGLQSSVCTELCASYESELENEIVKPSLG